MDETPVKLGYVGCGFVAQRIHIPNFASISGCRLLALAEVRRELGAKVASRYGIPKVYSSHHDLAADPEIEAVGVSAPYALQGRIAEDLLRAGKDVFMEKPMAVSVERAEAMVSAAQSCGRRLMVGYMKRYDTGNALLKQRLTEWRASGEFGRLILARNHGFCGNWIYQQDPSVPFEQSPEPPPPSVDDCPSWLPADRKNSYLGYLQQWTHNLNLLRFFLEEPGTTTRIESVHLDSDGMTGLVVLDIGGARAIVESGMSRYHGWEEHTQIYFEGGWLRTEAPALMQKETPATVEIYRCAVPDRPAQSVREYPPPGWAYREEAKHFISRVRSGEPFHSTAEDTLKDVRLFEEIYRRWLKV